MRFSKLLFPGVFGLVVFLGCWNVGAQSAIQAVWTTADDGSSTATGSLARVNVLVEGVNDPTLSEFQAEFDFTGVSFAAAPIAPGTGTISYDALSDFRVGFSEPVSGLLFYVIVWRPFIYTFDQPFEVLSGMEGATIVGNTITTGAGFTNGILRFTEPVSALSLETNSMNNSAQDLTVGVFPRPPAVVIRGRPVRRISSRRSRVVLRGTADAIQGVSEVRFKAGKRKFRLARGTDQWRARIKVPAQKRTGVRIVATSADGLVSAPQRVVIRRR